MPQVGTSHPTATICNGPQGISWQLIRSDLPHNPAGTLTEKQLSCDRPNIQGQHSQLSMKGANKTMGEEWSNNACRGYVIKAMENCGFHAKEIQQVLTELYEVFDFCAVEEAADYFENWQS